ncbi:hypothetical protein F5Y01DRAFT_269014 [Xylaria sp. FL0043]|nr:hypothetical protein F5Y01DRAFT_269014 [Xylaria sp. FL0043]
MATWGGFSRDGRIAPSNTNYYYLVGNNEQHDTASNSNNNTTTSTAVSTTTTTTANSSLNDNTNVHANTDTDAHADAAASSRCYYFVPLGNPDLHLQNIFTNGAISNRYALPPLPSPPANDSYFATVGDHLQTPLDSTPDNASIANYPLLRIGGSFHGVPLTPATLQPPLPTPAVPAATTAAPPITAPAPPNHPSSLGLPECHLHPSGGYNFYGHPRNYQPPTPPDVQASNRNSHPSAAPSLFSLATIPHMSSADHRPAPPISQAQYYSRATGATRISDDPYLSTLATENFSSPSLPALSDLPSPTTLSPSGRSSFAVTGQEMPPAPSRRRIPHRGGAVDLTKQEPDSEAPNSGVDSSIPLATVPVTTRRRSLTSVADSAVRKRSSAATSPCTRPSKTRRKETSVLLEGEPSPFEDDDISGIMGHDSSEMIDLSNATEVPAELMAPRVDNRVKIGKFQCVICMDDTTALTVTHCGHLFCSECLHSSLHIDAMKRTCPVCRTKVDLKGPKKTAKSYYHLELKIMTATKKGKRPAGT